MQVLLCVHVPTCSTCGSQCVLCDKWNDDGTHFDHPPCIDCGQREVVFRGEKTMEKFCSWLFSHQHRDVIAIAHNAHAYDVYFLYNYLLQQSIIPNIFFKGSKIMYCHVSSALNIRLLDSSNFLNMPLSQLPKSFGLMEMKKGYFPHLYNTQENNMLESKKHLMRLPDPSYYDVNNMHKKARDKFLQWYEIHWQDPFDMDRELLEYCCSDVDILLNACWKFRKPFMDITSPHHPIDPFDYITIASLCMGTFRAKFLPKEWVVLYKKDAWDKCMHRIWDCKCPWVKARKLYRVAPIKVYMGNGSWAQVDWWEVVTHRFVKSPIGLIPPHSYARRDKYSMHTMQWILLEEKVL